MKNTKGESIRIYEAISDFKYRFGLFRKPKNWRYKSYNQRINLFKWLLRIFIVIVLANVHKFILSPDKKAAMYIFLTFLLFAIYDSVILMGIDHITFRRKVLGVFNYHQKFLFKEIEWMGFKKILKFYPNNKHDYSEGIEIIEQNPYKKDLFQIKSINGPIASLFLKRGIILSVIDRVNDYKKELR